MSQTSKLASPSLSEKQKHVKTFLPPTIRKGSKKSESHAPKSQASKDLQNRLDQARQFASQSAGRVTRSTRIVNDLRSSVTEEEQESSDQVVPDQPLQFPQELILDFPSELTPASPPKPTLTTPPKPTIVASPAPALQPPLPLLPPQPPVQEMEVEDNISQPSTFRSHETEKLLTEFTNLQKAASEGTIKKVPNILIYENFRKCNTAITRDQQSIRSSIIKSILSFVLSSSNNDKRTCIAHIDPFHKSVIYEFCQQLIIFQLHKTNEQYGDHHTCRIKSKTDKECRNYLATRVTLGSEITSSIFCILLTDVQCTDPNAYFFTLSK